MRVAARSNCHILVVLYLEFDRVLTASMPPPCAPTALSIAKDLGMRVVVFITGVPVVVVLLQSMPTKCYLLHSFKNACETVSAILRTPYPCAKRCEKIKIGILCKTPSGGVACRISRGGEGKSMCAA